MTQAAHRILMTFDVTGWSEPHRRRLAASGADIAADVEAALAAVNDSGSDWTKKTIAQLVGMLTAQGAYTQALTINEALANGGQVTRKRVYELGDYEPDRSLKGFTRPIRRLVKQMKAQGLVPETAQVPLEPIYDGAVKGYQRTKGFRLIPGVVEFYAGDGQTAA